MRKELTIGLLTVALTVGMASMVSAQDSEEETDVNVAVDDVAIVDVRPSSLDYTAPSLVPGESRSVSDGGFEHVEISNIGSVDIEEVTAEATMPTNSPFAGSAESHNTGNFVTLSTETAETEGYSVGLAAGTESENPHYLNRVEYAEENPPEYIFTDTSEDMGDASFNPNNVDVGRLRVGGLEYFYAAYYNDGATGSEDSVLRVGRAPHTSTQLGTVDFTNDGDNYVEYDQTDIDDAPGNEVDGFYGQITGQELVVFNPDEADNSANYSGQNLLDASGNSDYTGEDFEGDYVREYNLYTNFEDGGSSNHIQRTRFNTQVYDATDDTDSPSRSDETTSGAQTPLVVGTGPDALNPGQNVPINFGVELPQGVDSSDITEGTVRFVVTADGE